MICAICGNEIESDYRTLNLKYEVKELPPPKPIPNPFRQVMKSTKFSGFSSGDLWIGMGVDLGLETFIDKAIICSNCEPEIDKIIESLKTLFQRKENKE